MKRWEKNAISLFLILVLTIGIASITYGGLLADNMPCKGCCYYGSHATEETRAQYDSYELHIGLSFLGGIILSLFGIIGSCWISGIDVEQ